MFASLLIANRGEIAVRIIRTAQRLGMRTVAVYSAADRGALHVRLADEAHEIGPPEAVRSYLDGERIIAAALAAGAEAVHPGYGFLAENAAFAEACAAAGLVFVGPPPAAIRAMGLKDEAKALMMKAGVPVVPGYHGARQEPEFLREKAYEIGYPVLVKPVAGGGGKGMRRVDRALDFDAALAGAKREAGAAFGDDRVLVEKFVRAPRHIEIQVFGDTHGNVVHLFERDCSLQRRHQKLVEEAPAPGMDATTRAVMGKAAVAAARAVDYVGAGTVEFIVDTSDGLRVDRFFFMEMNTRLQVEHPVTEAVTGLDLVEWQLRVAAGEPLPLEQAQIRLQGHAVEARLYAEDPASGFLPSTGRLERFDLARVDGVRLDAGVATGDTVSPYYDPMLAKIVATGTDRETALQRLGMALDRSLVVGPRTNIGFLRRLIDIDAFREGRFDTGLVDACSGDLVERPAGELDAVIALGALRLIEREMARLGCAAGAGDPWSATDGFQLDAPRRHGLAVEVDGVPRSVELTWDGGTATVAATDGAASPGELEARAIDADEGVYVVAGGRQSHIRLREPGRPDAAGIEGEVAIRAPMHGRMVSVDVTVEQSVARGQRLLVMEAMKMEHTLVAPMDGLVSRVDAIAGHQVGGGEILVVIRAQG